MINSRDFHGVVDMIRHVLYHRHDPYAGVEKIHRILSRVIVQRVAGQ